MAGNQRNGAAPAADEAQQPGMVERYQARWPWFDHLVRAGTGYLNNNGDFYAAAITYFSVLFVVPMLMIAFAVASFVLAGNQQLLAELQQGIREAAPPALGDTLNDVITTAIESRSGLGIVGLLGALYSGLAWIGYLRDALTAQWEQPHEAGPFLRTKIFDLLALVGLGLAFAASFAVTGLGTGLAGVVLEFLGLGDQLWARLLFYFAALVLSLAGMWLVFLWVIARLPRERVTMRSAMRAALFGAVGFEVLKQAFALYLGTVTNSPAGQLFGPVIGLMVFAYFVSRFILFVTAWAATAGENHQPETPSPPPPAVISPQVVVGGRPDVRSAAGLVGIGALAGGAVAGALGRRRR